MAKDDVHTVHSGRLWFNLIEGATGAADFASTKAAAEKLGRQSARSRRSVLVVHKLDGSIGGCVTYRAEKRPVPV